jgi:pimeloyl-ACP methyl ester carboxylesterase
MVPTLAPDGRVQSLVRAVMEHQKPLGVIGALKAMAERPDSVSMFSGLTIPVVVVHGDADALIPVERGRDMKTALPAAHFAEMAGLGHMTMMENPKALAEALKFFA